MADSEAGWRPGRLCPLCGRAVWYTGHVDVTAWGDENVSRKRGVYLCKNPACEKFETSVEPVSA